MRVDRLPDAAEDTFVAERLDVQLDDAMRRFLSDRERNRFDSANRYRLDFLTYDWALNDAR